MPKMKSLIICATPLQVMIAERIVALHPEESFSVLIYSAGKTPAKYRYYGDRLIAKCASGRYFEGDVFAGPLSRLAMLCYLIYYTVLFRLRYADIRKVYVSSFELVPIRLLLANLHKDKELHSFDDGLVSLLPESYNQNKSDGVKGPLFRLFGVPQTSEIRKLLKDHYTIYDAPNAAHATPKKIALFDELAEDANSYSEPLQDVAIFVGQPIYEIVEGQERRSKEVAEALVSALGCSYYLPHPREDYRVEGVEYADTPLFAEDYILQQLRAHPERRYTIYAYFSTVLLNLKAHPRLRVVACRPGSVPGRWQESYDFLERMGVEVRDFPEL